MKILVIQQKMIGDVLVSSLLCRHLKENLANPEIYFLANKGCEAVLLHNPHIDKIVLFQPEYRKSKLAFYGFLKEIRAANFDVVIDVYGKMESMLITWFSRASTGISHYKWYSRPIYTHAMPLQSRTKEARGLVIQDRLQLLKPLFTSLKSPGAVPKIYLREEEKKIARTTLAEKGIDLNRPLLMIGALGSTINKTYPFEYLAQVLDHVTEKMPDAILLFNYIPSQQDEIIKILDHCSPTCRKRIRADVYAENLRSFLGYLSQCSFLLSNEGGAVNMAKALDIPTFSIYSPWISREAWDTCGEDNRHYAVHLKDFLPDQYNSKSKKELKQNSQALYQVFKPEIFKDVLNEFLQQFQSD